ncbi:hypothetical protein ACL02T_20355 [Pseudonocardia sp. RS010]|uniref:hypothetical protein n=1 Tax=Pseudonocardia sp. RS010 TaxID=3385979 RepID=UPI0039A1E003
MFPYWADRVTPPAAVVGWPEPLTYDETFTRGGDRAELPIMVLVGKVDARTARDRLSVYADGSGSASIKAAIEAHPATAYSSARVTRVEFGVITVANVEYMAATFYIDVIGTGA